MDLLDPRDPHPLARSRLATWLAIQHHYAFQPQHFPEPLRDCPDPASRLSALEVPLLPQRSLERERAALAAASVRLLPIASPLYPDRLKRLRDAPPLLAVRGLAALLRARCVAIVGARAATAYGRQTARELAAGLTEAGVVVVSGLALGIDAQAHEGALQAGGATIAFQACGPEQVYPRAHRGLAQRIAEAGAVVSELPVGSPPRAQHFPLRNRLISAASEVVIVVEARLRSGSLLTARLAADQGVEVMAVPGAVHLPTSEGPLQLLRDGAGLVAGVGDVLAALGLESPRPRPGRASSSAPGAGRKLDPTGPAAALLQVLQDGPRSREGLMRALGVPPAAFAGALLELELDGRVVRDRDGRYGIASPLPGARL